jgi:hypothetical protein
MLLRPVSRGYNLSLRSFLRMWHHSELVGSGIQRSWIKPMSGKCAAWLGCQNYLASQVEAPGAWKHELGFGIPVGFLKIASSGYGLKT